MTAGLVVTAACGTSPSSSPTTSTTTARRTGVREELGPVLAELVESMQVPSAVVVVRSSKFGDATFRFGSRVLGGDDPPATSDHYRIGSITKTMTATVILQLVQEGKVSLDDPISKYRPDVPNGDNITIAQLLDMRSGLAGYTENPAFQRAVDEDPERIWSPDELLALAFSAPALFPPGTAWQYSNTNYILLGLVMEDVTGQTVPELFQERLFDPLGMDSTVMPALDDASMPAVYAHGYQFGTAEKTFGPDPALPADEQQAAADGELLPADWSEANPVDRLDGRIGDLDRRRPGGVGRGSGRWRAARPRDAGAAPGIDPTDRSRPARRPGLRLGDDPGRLVLRARRPDLGLRVPGDP